MTHKCQKIQFECCCSSLRRAPAVEELCATFHAGFARNRKEEPMATQPTSLQPYTLQAREGQAVWYTSTRMTLKATGESTGGTISIVEALAAPDTAPPWHVHRYDDEMFYILEGSSSSNAAMTCLREVPAPSSSCRVASRTASRS